jgi:phosphohistidine phosphatase
VSQFLKNEIVHPNELIWYSSTAVRALHTALIFARNMEVQEKNIILDKSLYHCDAEEMLLSIQAVPEDFDSAIFFAHNPAITDLVNQLTKASINNVPTTGLVSIRFNCEKWKYADAGAELIQFQYPKGLKR